MKRTPLGAGTKSLERGSTFASRGNGLKRTAGPKRSTTKRRRQAISPASDPQREKVRNAVSIVSGREGCDPAHLWPRSLGGCDDPLCVVPLTRAEHRAYDTGDLDLLPHLIKARCIPELQHAIAHADGSLLRLIHCTTGQRHVPVASGAGNVTNAVSEVA